MAEASNSQQNGASHLIHQTNAAGVQNTVILSPTTPPENETILEKFMRVCCCYIGPSRPKSLGGVPPRPVTTDLTPLLGEMSESDKGKICLVLDLDETLVHSSFKPVASPDFVIPVDIEGVIHNIYVLKRPGVDEFLEEVGKIFEVVIYTASLNKYADPLLDWLDKTKAIKFRLFREHCTFYDGVYVKDLSRIGRELKRTIIIDNSAMSYLFHPENAIGISTFIDDPKDRELFYCLDFLKNIANKDNVYGDLPSYPSFIVTKAQEYADSNQS